MTDRAPAPADVEALIEWRERVGVRLMLAMTCTHEGDDFGPRAVCVTCFDNVQRVGAIVESLAATAWDLGRTAERRDWELTADLTTPDEDRQPLTNPYRVLPPISAEETSDAPADAIALGKTACDALDAIPYERDDYSDAHMHAVVGAALLASPALTTLRAHAWDEGWAAMAEARNLWAQDREADQQNPYRADRQEPQ